MNTFTKFFGTIVIFFGLMLIFTGYESTDLQLGEVVALTLLGLLIIALGAILWVWCEPYEGPEM